MLPDGLAELFMRRYEEAFRGGELMQEYERYSSSMPSVLCCSFSAVPADLLMSVVHSSAVHVFCSRRRGAAPIFTQVFF
jgi:hypothetical protein